MLIKLIVATLLFVSNINYASAKPSRALLQTITSPIDTTTLLINPVILTTDDNINNNEQTKCNHSACYERNIVGINLEQCICIEILAGACIYLPFNNPAVLDKQVIVPNVSNCDTFMHSLSEFIKKPRERIQTYLAPLIDNSLENARRYHYAIQISFDQIFLTAPLLLIHRGKWNPNDNVLNQSTPPCDNLKRSIHNDNDNIYPFVSNIPSVLLNDAIPSMFLNQYSNSLKAFLYHIRNWVFSGINNWFSSNQSDEEYQNKTSYVSDIGFSSLYQYEDAIKYFTTPLDMIIIMLAFGITPKCGLSSFIIMTTFSIDTAVAQQCIVSNIDYLGDGYCDGAGYNSLECQWDKGDCCEESCISTVDYDCGSGGYDCLDPQYSVNPTVSPSVNPSVSTISPTAKPTHVLFSNNWIVSNTKLPVSGHYMAGGFWNDTLSIFGGYMVNPANYMEYNIRTDTAVDLSASIVLSSYVSGGGQFYTQQQDQLFMIAAGNVQYILLFNLATKNDILGYGPEIPRQVAWMYGNSDTGCLASTAEFLYVVGGMMHLTPMGLYAPSIYDYLQILTLETFSWQDGPRLINARGDAACVITPNDYLFALGGVNTHSIERINTQNILSNAWEEFGQLSVYPGQSVWDGRTAIAYGENILLIGGTHMIIINTFTGLVEYGPAMNIPVVYAAVVMAQKTIYTFGGRDSTNTWIDTIQYYILPETEPPTFSPTESPTSFTTSPTTNPSASPTNPTNVPTTAPSNAPSLAPSQAPTAPTVPPSTHPTPAPTYNPITKSPTLYATLNPSNRPTKFPTKTTKPPTGSPTIAPSDAPTIAPTISAETMQYLQDLDDLEYLYQLLLILFVLLFGMISFFAWLDSTKKCRTNDYFKISQISAAAFQALDMYSDCFFAVNVSIQNKLNSQYFIALIFSIIFIVIPASLTIGQLYYHSQKHWVYSSDKVRGWMSKRAKALYLLSILTGNAFAAVSLVNSYMFQLSFFDMGLTDKEISAFNYKRVYTVILFENLPQLGIQAWYLSTFGALDDPITISSIIFSLISIIVSVLSMSVQKSLSQTEGHVAITLHVTGNEVMVYKKRCKTRKTKLEKKLAAMVGVDPSRVQVIKPLDIKNGFELILNFYFLDINKTPIDYYKILIDEKKTGELQTAFKEGWKLDAEPIVDIMSRVRMKSKNKRRSSQKTEQAETYALQMATLKSKNKDPSDKSTSLIDRIKSKNKDAADQSTSLIDRIKSKNKDPTDKSTSLIDRIKAKNKDAADQSTSLIDRTNGGKQTNTKHQTVSRNDDEGYQE